MGTGDEDAEEGKRTVAGHRNAVRGHADAKDHLLRKNDAAVDFTYIYGLVEDL